MSAFYIMNASWYTLLGIIQFGNAVPLENRIGRISASYGVGP
jgi:hypothetical protein